MDNKILNLFNKNGFVEFENIFSSKDIDKWNSTLDTHYRDQSDKVNIDLLEVGKPGFEIIKGFLNDKVKFIISCLIKDPVIFYAGSNEIPAKQKISHVNHNEIEGWHTDTGENLQYLDLNNPLWITFFVYLSDVGINDGAFEISNVTKKKNIKNNMNCFKMIGNKGKCFVWGNPFFHRASPNLGDKRRRILKIQIQHNYLENSYSATLKKNYEFIEENENYLKYIFGQKHFNTYRDWKLDSDVLPKEVDIVDASYNSQIKLKKFNSFKKRIKDFFA